MLIKSSNGYANLIQCTILASNANSMHYFKKYFASYPDYQVLPEEGNIEIFSSCDVRTSNLIVPEYPGNEYIIQVALV